jgi:hypothetical protein
MIQTAALVFLLQLPLVPMQMPGMQPKSDDFNLGLLGASGNPAADGKSIVVTKVFDNGPGKAGGLEPGDTITQIAGQGFPRKVDAIYHLVDMIEAVTTAKKSVLPVTVLRDGKPTKLKVPFPSLGKHAKSCPKKCKRCGVMVQQSLQWLADAQQGDGSWPGRMGSNNQKVAISCLGGMAFLASGSTPKAGPYAKNVTKCMKLAINIGGKERGMRSGRSGGANWNQVNWSLGYSGTFLGLLHKRHPDAAVRAKMEEIAADICKNQEPSGGWAHGPGGPNALNYLELEIMSNWCMLALGLARQAGIEVPQETIDKGVAYMELCTNGDGSVSYSPRKGQIGRGDPGRTGGCIVAYQSLGLHKHKNMKKSISFLTRGFDKLHDGHVSPVMHFLSGGMAAHGVGGKTWKAFTADFRREFLAARKPDGTFAARPTKESKQMGRNQDAGMGAPWITTSYLIIQQLPYGHLKWQGK